MQVVSEQDEEIIVLESDLSDEKSDSPRNNRETEKLLPKK